MKESIDNNRRQLAHTFIVRGSTHLHREYQGEFQFETGLLDLCSEIRTKLSHQAHITLQQSPNGLANQDHVSKSIHQQWLVDGSYSRHWQRTNFCNARDQISAEQSYWLVGRKFDHGMAQIRSRSQNEYLSPLQNFPFTDYLLFKN